MKKSISGLVVASVVLAASAAVAQAPATAPSTESFPAASAAPVPAVSEAPRIYTDSASLVVSGKAGYNGTIQVEFTPLGAPARLVRVNVLAKTGRKDIAKDLHKELVIAAGALYKVKLSGDTIKITKAKGAQNFSVLLEKLDISGVSVLVKKG